MSAFLDFNSIVYVVGWSLLHLVWEGALLAAALWVALATARNASPNARYLLSSAVLFCLCAIGVANLFALHPARNVVHSYSAVAVQSGQHYQQADDRPDLPTLKSNSYRRTSDSGQNVPATAVENSSEALQIPELSASAVREFSATCNNHIVLLVFAWAFGALLFSLRLFAGWIGLRNIYKGSVLLAGAELEEAFIRLAGAMAIHQRVRILLTRSGSAPITFGVLKPVILFPASLLTSIPAGELEALLAHELAHIRRYDFLLNLFQSAAETLLYYHPAVWWISANIRKEREMCCDNIAASACAGGHIQLARALTRIEEMRGAVGRLSLAAGGAPLMARIAKLLHVRSMPGTCASVVIALSATPLLLTTIFVCNCFGQMQPLDGKAIDGITSLPQVSTTSSDAQPSASPSNSQSNTKTAQVFDLRYVAGGVHKQAEEIPQVLQQIQKLLYADGEKPNAQPDRRFWYDDDTGLLTITDTAAQLAHVSTYLQQSWVQAQLQQGSQDTTAVVQLLQPGWSMRMGDIALRLESLTPIAAGKRSQAHLLVRNDQRAYLYDLKEELDSFQAGNSWISYVETVPFADGATSAAAARIEIRMPREKVISQHLPPLPKLYNSANVENYYEIQLGTALTDQASVRLQDDLRNAGYTPVKRVLRNSGYYDVMVGNLHDRAEAEIVEKNLRTNGFTPKGILSPHSNVDAMPDVN